AALDATGSGRGPFAFPVTLDGSGIELLLGDPASLEAGFQDHFLGLFARDREVLEGALETLDLAILALGPADEIVGGTTGEILDGLDVFLAERHQHGGGQALNLVEFVLDTQFLALLVELAVDLGKILDGAVLDLDGGLFVEPLDRGDFFDLDIGEL